MYIVWVLVSLLSSSPAVVPSLLSASPSFSLSFPGPPGRLGFLGLLGGSGLQKLPFSLRISLRIHHFQLPGPPGSLGAPKMLIFIKNFNKNSSFLASWASWEAPGGPPGALPGPSRTPRNPPTKCIHEAIGSSLRLDGTMITFLKVWA